MECKLSQKEEGAACLATVVTGAVSRLCRAAADNTGFLPSVAAGHECWAVHWAADHCEPENLSWAHHWEPKRFKFCSQQPWATVWNILRFVIPLMSPLMSLPPNTFLLNSRLQPGQDVLCILISVHRPTKRSAPFSQLYWWPSTGVLQFRIKYCVNYRQWSDKTTYLHPPSP